VGQHKTQGGTAPAGGVEGRGDLFEEKTKEMRMAFLQLIMTMKEQSQKGMEYGKAKQSSLNKFLRLIFCKHTMDISMEKRC
jgi:hypothetical protein